LLILYTIQGAHEHETMQH